LYKIAGLVGLGEVLTEFEDIEPIAELNNCLLMGFIALVSIDSSGTISFNYNYSLY